VFPDKNVILFLKRALIDQVKHFLLASRLLDDLSFEVALQLQTLVKLPGFFVFYVQLREEAAFHHISNFVSLLYLHLSLDSIVDIDPNISV